MKKIYAIVFILCSSIISGCGLPPAERTISLAKKNHGLINLTYKEKNKLKDSKILVKVHKVIDLRTYQNNIGFLCRTQIIAKDVLVWIDNYLATLENFTKLSNNKNEIILKSYIKKLYLQNIYTSKTATAVLHVDYLKNNKTILSKIYRKQLTAINWNSTDDEIITILNKVFHEVRNDIIEDLSNVVIDDRDAFEAKSTE